MPATWASLYEASSSGGQQAWSKSRPDTDQGIRAIGDYQPAPDQAPMPDQDAMYDQDNDTGTLRLNVLTFASKTPVTTRTAMSLLKARRQQYQGMLTDLGKGNAVLRYTDVAQEEGESLTIHCWQIANVVPPNHFRLAIFSYTKSTELADETWPLTWRC
jgi:hypothetical protein